MQGKEDLDVSGMKIKRARRRLYEPLPEGNGVIKSETEPKDVSVEIPQGVPKEEYARKIIRDHALWSGGAALIPVPFLDMAAVTAFQVKMVKRLCEHYGMEFSGQRSKALIASLLGGLYAGLIAGSLIKAVPVVGMAGAAAPAVAAAGGLTYAVGMVFMQHFEAGGTLLDFDPSKVRGYFIKQYEEGRNDKQI